MPASFLKPFLGKRASSSLRFSKLSLPVSFISISALNMSENSLRHYFLLTLLAFGMNLWEQCMAALGLGLMLLLAADRISYGHSLAALLIPPHRRGYFFPIALFAHNISLKRSPRFSHRAVDFLYI